MVPIRIFGGVAITSQKISGYKAAFLSPDIRAKLPESVQSDLESTKTAYRAGVRCAYSGLGPFGANLDFYFQTNWALVINFSVGFLWMGGD